MAEQRRLPKSDTDNLRELEDHLHFLAEALRHIAAGDAAYARQATAELRVLVCKSSRNSEGLLWRLLEQHGVSDEVHVSVVGRVDTSNPLMEGISFLHSPVRSPDTAPAAFPAQNYSLRMLVKEYEAVYVANGPVTHENLIRGIAEQMGSAHADAGISHDLAQLVSVLTGGTQVFVKIIHSDGLLTLEVGERLLVHVVREIGYERQRAAHAPMVTLPGPLALGAPVQAPTIESLDTEEGAMALVVGVPNPTAWVNPDSEIVFPVHVAGSVRVEVGKLRGNQLSVRVVGLFMPGASCIVPLPPLLDHGLAVVVTWKRPTVDIWANGQRLKLFVDNSSN